MNLINLKSPLIQFSVNDENNLRKQQYQKRFLFFMNRAKNLYFPPFKLSDDSSYVRTYLMDEAVAKVVPRLFKKRTKQRLNEVFVNNPVSLVTFKKSNFGHVTFPRYRRQLATNVKKT